MADAQSRTVRTRYWLRSTALGAAIGVCILAIGTLGHEVYEQLENLETANSDNVNWTLSQLEVEFLQFELAAHEAGRGGSLDDLRRKFDIFYSRLVTIDQGSAYRELTLHEDFSVPLLRLRDFLDRTVPLIDGPPEELQAALPRLRATADAVHDDVRKLALSGLEQFVARSDATRESIASTLLDLALLTTALVLVLILLLILLLRMIRISDRQAQTQRITASRLQTILATSLDAVVVVDSNGIVREFNGAAERVFGYTRDEAMGQAMSELLMPETYRRAHEAGMKRHRQTGARRLIGSGRVELEALRKSGEIFPVELSVDVADDRDGEIYVAYMRDITDRRRAQEELVDARDRALAGEKARADFLAVMSHEMRTPLNGLLGTLNLLRDTVLTQAQRAYVDIMDNSGRLLLHHVNDVLDISKFEAGKVELTSSAFDLDRLLREIVAIQQSVAATQGNMLGHRWIGDPPGTVVGDPVRLRQVLLNLVGNALKFTHGGEVTIEVEVDTAGERPCAEFRVIDTGIGIPERDLDRIFKDFETVDSTYGRQFGGTGLGLGIARRLTLAMGGEIGAESIENAGSVFWVRLPLERRAQNGPDGPESTPRRPDRVLDVLIVEDNRVNRVVLRAMLERDGHRVTEAESGEQGVALAARTRFDAILMDISMPVMDGVAATRAIRDGTGASRRTPILAVTAHALPADIETFRAAGMSGHITKPIDHAVLADLLQRPAGVAADPADVPRTAPPVGQLVDFAKVAELTESLGAEQVHSLLGRFGTEAEAAIAALRACDDEMPDDTALALLHRLAGSAGTLGFAGLHAQLSQFQTDAREGQRRSLAGTADVLERLWSESRKELEDLVPC
ncbi:PAS domain S-box protein [Rhodobacteraceae bacterium 2CG4]|uniref:histidine kinase n=1 Tax=Halovulum marinum TaxID=2662447 RepID=A0A6L5Z3E8_9RHOB|nr:PAS domain-containing hybrid sensor histidine kinase/response regulator [Halovulum marinum]MSU90590.1 PAS domain S-box protein [Halovulum marinum]